MTKNLKIKDDANAVLRAFENTDICIFMYYPQTKKIYVPKKACDRFKCEAVYENMPHSFAKSFVHEDDYDIFNDMYFKIDAGAATATTDFHSKDFKYFTRVTLTTIKKNEDGAPLEVLGIIEDITELYRNEMFIKQIQKKLDLKGSSESDTQEAMNLIASSIGEQYYAIFHVWMHNHNYMCFQHKIPGLLSVIGRKGNYETTSAKYIEKYVETEDQEAVGEFFDISTLQERLESANSITKVYRRKNVGWTKGQFIAAKRDDRGKVTNVIFTVSDVNEEVKREQRQKKVIFEAEHDPLTGVFNRKGFDNIIKKYNLQQRPIGFILMDVDHFKSINDNYGHEVGDKILKKVAECFIETFREEDCVFRFGGDEFGILLNNCKEDIWHTICQKLEYIHSVLKDTFKENGSVTISMGVFFSGNGYSEEVFALADEALYETKRNGRAGITLIDKNHTIKKRWRDDKASLHTEGALVRSTTGVYRMEFPKNPDEAPRMFCNEMTKMILGVSADATPEECYSSWIKGVDSSYSEALWETRKRMLSEQQAECTYLWKHPVWGQIYVRSGGFGETTHDMEVISGYHHALKDTVIVERRDDSKKIVAALNDVFFTSCYLNLKNNAFSTIKTNKYSENMMAGCQNSREAFDSFIEKLVQPEYVDKMRVFCDIDTVAKRLKNHKHIDCEYKSKVAEGWCQASFILVDCDIEGEPYHVLFVISRVDANKALELEEGISNKKSLVSLFNNVPGGIVLYEWNGEKLKTLRISQYYAEQYGYSPLSGESKNQDDTNFMKIHPDDVENYKKTVLEYLAEKSHFEHVYRVWNKVKKKYVWVKLSAVADLQPNGISLVYAMYSDITEQKDVEKCLEKNRVSLRAALSASNQLCYEYDPVEHSRECYTEDNFLDLPKRIENYPEALHDLDVIHPDDEKLFIRTAHLMDKGTKKAQCDVRIKKNGEYVWYSCLFNLYYDSEKERNVAILTVSDISLRVAAIHDYEERLRLLLGVTDNALMIGSFNLSKNTYKNFQCEDRIRACIDESKSFDEIVDSVAGLVVGDDMQRQFYENFNCKNLYDSISKGRRHIQFEHLFRIPGSHTEWLETVVYMIKNPITSEISGVYYLKSIQDTRLSSLLLKKTFKQDYPVSVMIFADTDEYYLFDAERGKFGECEYDFWDNICDILHPIAPSISMDILKEYLVKEKVITYLESGREYDFSFDSTHNGVNRRLKMKFSYLEDNDNLIIASLQNITDEVLLEKLRHDSEHDFLTDLYNRRTLFRECKKLLAEHPDENFAMLHMDIRYFHLYNTFFGEETGDVLLCDIAAMLHHIGEEYKYWVYGRIESDVFCALFPFDQSKYDKNVKYIVNELSNYREDFLIEPVFGLYHVEDKNMPVESMFARAAIASKSIRTGVSNITGVFDESMEKKLIIQQQIVNEMQIAIDKEEFEIYLQPKYSLRTNKPVGAEALVRWNHPHRGLLSPAQFIPIFERNGFIAILDRYVWEHVCMILRRWIDEGKTIAPVSVNVSRISMFSPTTVLYIKKLVEKYNIDPKYLEIELTENVYIDNPDEMKNQMRNLRAFGFKILLDDFGSSYSSLNTLRELPVDCLKLDMKFLSSMEEDLRGRLVISSIIRMSKILELYVVAEGVETQVQADYLRSVGCEYVQGFLFAKPMPVKDYEKIMASWEVPLDNINKSSTEHIGNMLGDTVTSSYSAGEILPVPMGILEYFDGKFAYLRVNPIFLTEFGLTEDLQAASKIFRNHLSDENYQNMMEAYEKCADTEEMVDFKFVWEDENNIKRKYVGRVSFEGKIENAALMVVVFTNVTNL